MTNFEVIKSMTIGELAAYLHNVQESAIKNNHVEDEEDIEMFFKKEVADGVHNDKR